MPKKSYLKFISFGRFGDEFATYIRSSHPSISVVVPSSTLELSEAIKEANCYAGFNALDGLDVSHLSWIHAFGAGVDGFLANPTITTNNIPISRSTGKMGHAMGQYCLAHILRIFQNLDRYQHQQEHQHWKQLNAKTLTETEVIILGTGAIGSAIAEVLRPLGCHLVGVNSAGRQAVPFAECLTFNDLEKRPMQDIVLINALPLTSKTEGLLDLGFLSRLKESVFINVGRGQTVESDSVIIQALESKYLSHAILDVFGEEPLSSSSQLWTTKNVTITPHVAALTSLNDVIHSFENSLRAYLSRDFSSFVNHHRGY